ncbi:lysophospholipid acyltransferase family protein [Pirellulaceae bacterium SH449]
MNRFSLRSIARQIAIYSVGKCLSGLVNAWVHTVDCKIARRDPLGDPAMFGFKDPTIFVIWHEYMLVPTCCRQGCDLVLLASQSEDADWIVGLGNHFGYSSVRGSSKRGGSEAALKMVKQLRGKSFVITPDGPRGPRRVAQNGCLYLASMLGAQIVPIGVGYERPFRFTRSWDQFAVPRPGARARLVLGDIMRVPKKVSKDEIEVYHKRLQDTLVEVTTEAEAWVQHGRKREDEHPFYTTFRETLWP